MVNVFPKWNSLNLVELIFSKSSFSKNRLVSWIDEKSVSKISKCRAAESLLDLKHEPRNVESLQGNYPAKFEGRISSQDKENSAEKDNAAQLGA